MVKRKVVEASESKALKVKKSTGTKDASKEVSEFDMLKSKVENLKKENEVLMNENKKNIEKICMLEETIKQMEKKLNSVEIEQNSVANMRCNECEYPAEDIYDLGEHMYMCYGSNEESISCNYCDDKFKAKAEIMKHKKGKHNEKVHICRYFSAGNCIFGSEKCWYKHDKLENDSNEKVTVENQELWDKLLSMMEQMTERITLMENQNKEK